MARPVADVIEDLEWLDQSGVGALDAAERTDFPNAHAMEKWLERHDRWDLWLRMKRRDPEGTHKNGTDRARMQAVEAQTRDHIATLLLQGEKSPRARTRTKVEKIRALLDDLRAALDEDKARDEARREVEKLERQLREAKARLAGKSTEATSGPKAADVRAWARDNDVECPAMGRIPTSVATAYLAAQS